MKAMIFAAGIGSRLKPYTLVHPKALVPVGGVPMLQRVIFKLEDAGVDSFVVNIHHFGKQIEDFLIQNNGFGARIAISDETSKLLDTGGGLLAAAKWLQDSSEPFLAHNADILCDAPVAPMIECHEKSKADVTLLVSERATSRYLLFDDGMHMRGWCNASTGEIRPGSLDAASMRRLAFGGIHVLSPSVFPLLKEYSAAFGCDAFSLVPFYIWACDRLRIIGHVSAGQHYWHDIGKPESLARAQKEMSML